MLNQASASGQVARAGRRPAQERKHSKVLCQPQRDPLVQDVGVDAIVEGGVEQEALARRARDHARASVVEAPPLGTESRVRDQAACRE